MKTHSFRYRIGVSHKQDKTAVLFEYLKTYIAQIFNPGPICQDVQGSPCEKCSNLRNQNSETHVVILPYEQHLELVEKVVLPPIRRRANDDKGCFY